jgi:uncharacterized protein (TIGR00299 family) protein
MTERILYLDLFSGASGDMLLGALVDAGLSLELLRAQLGKLDLGGYELEAEVQLRHGIAGTKVHVHELAQAHPARHLANVRDLLAASPLSSRVRDASLAVFERLARVEAHIHGTSPDLVHFHEISAVDSLVDIVGFAIAMEALEVASVYSSPVPLGSGTITVSHGVIPVPAPATLALLAEVGAPTVPHQAQTEIVTPTAAAILAQYADFRRPAMHVRAVGYGFGTKEFAWPNALRVWLGEDEGRAWAKSDHVIRIECNLDDTTGEALGYAMERLFEAGALDVWFAPVQMKKNRPGTVLSVLARPEEAETVAQVVLRETSTLGVRLSPPLERIVAARTVLTVETPWGPVRVKEKRLGGESVSASPEYEDCALIARQQSIPLAQVVATVMRLVEVGGSSSPVPGLDRGR